MKNSSSGMSLIVKTITRLTVGLILIYGIYVTFEGHKGPGGGFAGGVIIALSFIHLMLAFGKSAVIPKLNENRGTLIVGLSACAVLAAFFIPAASRVFEAASACLVAAGFFIVFLVLVTVAGNREGAR